MNIWDGEYAFSIQAAFRSESIALSHPVIRFQLGLFWSITLLGCSGPHPVSGWVAQPSVR
jgi:hypothetical protein